MNQSNTKAGNTGKCSSVNEATNNEVSTVKPSTNYNVSAMMKRHRSRKAIQLVLVFGLLLSCLVPAQGQVLATQRAGFGLPANQVAAPNTPGGGVVVGSFFYATDQVNGFRHYLPADPTTPDPVNSGILIFDNIQNDGMSIGGAAVCIPFCKSGQVAYDGNQTVWVTAFDQQKGQPGSVTFPGVHRLLIDPLAGYVSWMGPIAQNLGLGGPGPTSIALGPDGNLYVGFQKSGNIVRVTNPQASSFDPNFPQIVQSIGTSPNGRPTHALAFVGPDLYLATADGLSVIRNPMSKTCTGGCNAVLVSDGFSGADHVGLVSDGLNRLYMSINGQGVFRFTILPQSTTLISTGGTAPDGTVLTYAFVGGHTNMLFLDRLGNLWVGDDIGDGRINFDGRIWYISAGQLASIP
ncbi:MAG TPA: hypothetical protein VHW72_15810 [Candidatus Angelobacter sp.]|nr:hypothetical protein [Candidatus Angelobacter sp.]